MRMILKKYMMQIEILFYESKQSVVMLRKRLKNLITFLRTHSKYTKCNKFLLNRIFPWRGLIVMND